MKLKHQTQLKGHLVFNRFLFIYLNIKVVINIQNI